MARTDANAADLLTSDCDPYDQPFVTGERTKEGFYKVRAVAWIETPAFQKAYVEASRLLTERNARSAH